MNVQALDIGYRYRHDPVLQEVSFTLASGRFHALLGPNGAGKSTLFGLLTRLHRQFICLARIIRILCRRAGHLLHRRGRLFQARGLLFGPL